MAYLDRVEREMLVPARQAQPERTGMHRKKARYTGSMQTDFWVVSALMRAQNSRCYWCCCQLVGRKFHVDHVHPRSKGGPDTPENLRISCIPCNLKKRNTRPGDFALLLLS